MKKLSKDQKYRVRVALRKIHQAGQLSLVAPSSKKGKVESLYFTKDGKVRRNSITKKLYKYIVRTEKISGIQYWELNQKGLAFIATNKKSKVTKVVRKTKVTKATKEVSKAWRLEVNGDSLKVTKVLARLKADLYYEMANGTGIESSAKRQSDWFCYKTLWAKYEDTTHYRQFLEACSDNKMFVNRHVNGKEEIAVLLESVV